MSDQIKGEVLVPACRFITGCEHNAPMVAETHTFTFSDSLIADIAVKCKVCGKPYEVFNSLARSHKRIIKAVKKSLEPQPNDAQSELVHAELVAAIEEGERL